VPATTSPDRTSAAARAVLAGLDAEQHVAVLAPAGPVRILAGAGTGKTRTITHRIAYQHLTGAADARRTLAVTHSSRAAGEMRDRLAALGVTGAQARTFHSAALRQLTYFWTATGLPGPRPALVSSLPGGRYSMLRRALADVLALPPNRVESTDVLDVDGEITWAAARRLAPEQYAAAAAAAGRSRTQPATIIAAAYARYRDAKTARAVLDFDDLLAECAALIETDATVAARVREQYTHFVVDEYQDTDPAQQRLLDAWLGDRDTVTVVGDPSQQIYSFKGAEASLLRGFTTKYPHAVCVSLVRDYRSTPQVTDAANRLMAATGTLKVHLEGQQPPGPPVHVRGHDNEDAELAGIAARVQQLLETGTAAAEIAVLHRFNAQAVKLTAALRDAGIAVTTGTDDKFFTRPEIVAILAALTQTARATPDAPGRAAFTQAAATVGFDPSREPGTVGAARERWEAQSALTALVTGLPDPACATAATLATELARRGRDEHVPAGAAAVTVSTIHKAKGLEWDAVLLAHATEGSLPSVFATSPDELAEERRLLYVAITRGRRIVEVSYARYRGDGTGRRGQTRSRFLSDLAAPPARRRILDSLTGPQPAADRGPGHARPRTAPRPVPPVGSRVTHDRHGLGTITARSVTTLTVDFGTGGTRRIPTGDPQLVPL